MLQLLSTCIVSVRNKETLHQCTAPVTIGRTLSQCNGTKSPFVDLSSSESHTAQRFSYCQSQRSPITAVEAAMMPAPSRPDTRIDQFADQVGLHANLTSSSSESFGASHSSGAAGKRCLSDWGTVFLLRVSVKPQHCPGAPALARERETAGPLCGGGAWLCDLWSAES